jgi:hypothetical protein
MISLITIVSGHLSELELTEFVYEKYGGAIGAAKDTSLGDDGDI